MRPSTVAGPDLTRELLALANRGVRVRCSDPGTHETWTSDDADERALAASWCTGCPVLEACGTTAEANDERFGVWGGVDRTVTPASLRKAAKGASENPAVGRPAQA